MFKNFLLFISCLTLLSPAVALAASEGDGHYGIDDTLKAINKDGPTVLPKSVAGGTDIPSIIGKIVATLLALIGIVFFLLALYAGFIWMTAMGNTEQVTKAKDILEAAAIGLVIVSAAYAITRFVFTSLVGGSVSAPGGGAGVLSSMAQCKRSCILAYCSNECNEDDFNVSGDDVMIAGGGSCNVCVNTNKQNVQICGAGCQAKGSPVGVGCAGKNAGDNCDGAKSGATCFVVGNSLMCVKICEQNGGRCMEQDQCDLSNNYVKTKVNWCGGALTYRCCMPN